MAQKNAEQVNEKTLDEIITSSKLPKNLIDAILSCDSLDEQDKINLMVNLENVLIERHIINKEGEFCPNRETCVGYLASILPKLTDEFFDDADMNIFLDRFCFVPKRKGKTSFVLFLKDKELLDNNFNPTQEFNQEIFWTFSEVVDKSPFEMVEDISIINEFWEEHKEEIWL